MIVFAVAFLPFVVCMLAARVLARRGLTGFARPPVVQQPPEVQQPTGARPGPPAATLSLPATDHAAVPDTMPSAWTALDDLQLDRLLKESSS
jgi:hypothetical protein